MNNDLISREALKKQFEELHLHPDLIELIDNAPTVPQDCSDCKRYDFPYFEIKFDKEQMQEIVDKVLASIERPQGEWVVDDWSKIIECNKCRGQAPIDITSGEQYRSNFCPICGANMKGGAE